VISALIRLCCFILLIPSWEGKMPIPERSKNSRGICYPRGLERECLTWRCRIEKGQQPQTGCINRPDRRLHPTNASEHQISSCNVGAIHRRPSHGHAVGQCVSLNRPLRDGSPRKSEAFNKSLGGTSCLDARPPWRERRPGGLAAKRLNRAACSAGWPASARRRGGCAQPHPGIVPSARAGVFGCKPG
jgi:hypothetical protein